MSFEQYFQDNNVIAKSSVLASTSKNNEDKPLVITRSVTSAELKNRKVLDPKQIFVFTNKERQKQGLKPLVWNNTLAEIADYKCKDMVNKNYFAHVSPDKKDVSDLAVMKKYDYSLIGENLAMGDFLSSSDVVDGWMQSPGHRANILKTTYTEIGISAIPTIIDGKMSWYAVQTFGKPAPICAKPNPKTEAFIKSGNNIIDSTNKTLGELEVKINSERDINKKNQLINSYNSLSTIANNLHIKIAQSVTEYNTSVTVYNNCIKADK